MKHLEPPYRPARPDDARALAELVNMAGEGLPLYVWTGMALPGESPWEVGRNRARRESGGFSYHNAIVREENQKVVACLIGYPLPDEPAPANYDELPAMFVPLQQLEDEAPGTWYVNVLATYPYHRHKGYGGELLDIAEQIAVRENRKGISVIVADANKGARRIYDKHGYRVYARRPMIKMDWVNDGRNWLLLIKDIARGR